MAIIEDNFADERGLDSDVAFEDLCAKSCDALRSSCRAMLRDDAAAADVVQEALLRAWIRRHNFDDAVHRQRWLWQVARNLSIDTIRARQRAIPVGLLSDLEGAGSDHDARLEREIDDRCVQMAFGKLKPRHQQLLYLHDVAGVSYVELGARVGVTTETARVAVFRARRSLRRRLAALGPSDG